MTTDAIDSSITIRRAGPGDAPALAQLLRSIKLNKRMENEAPETVLGYVQRHVELCCADDSHSVYVACAGELVGYIAVHWLPYLILPGPEGFVSELFIADQERGHGVGSRLLDTVREEAVRRGCSRLHLVNFRDRESYRRQFYTKAG